MNKHIAIYCALLASLALSTGCGKDTAARVSMKNATSGSFMNQLNLAVAAKAPGYLGAKIIAIYLGSTKTNGHVPSEATLWFHPDCLVPEGEGDGSKRLDGSGEAHIARCGIEKGATASNTEASTIDHQVQSYINLAQSTTDLNAQLGAQALTVKAGTYKYVGITMADPTSGSGVGTQSDEDGTYSIGAVPSIKLWDSSMSGATALVGGKPVLSESKRTKLTAVWNQEIPEITIADGDQVEFTLSYDLSAAYLSGSCSSGYTEVASGHCLKFPDLTVTVEKKDLE